METTNQDGEPMREKSLLREATISAVQPETTAAEMKDNSEELQDLSKPELKKPMKSIEAQCTSSSPGGPSTKSAQLQKALNSNQNNTINNQGASTTAQDRKSTIAEEENRSQHSAPAQSSPNHSHKQLNSDAYFKIKDGATQQVLIVHDTDSIYDETIDVAPQQFSLSQTDLRGRPNMISSAGSMRRRSCGAAEIGVILSSDQGQQQAGTMHQMDEITAEVDEQDEYSNDFEENSKHKNSSGEEDLDSLQLREAQSEDGQKVQRAGYDGGVGESTSRTISQKIKAPVMIQEVYTVLPSSPQEGGSPVSQIGGSPAITVSAQDNQEVIFREVMMPEAPLLHVSVTKKRRQKVSANPQESSKIKPVASPNKSKQTISNGKPRLRHKNGAHKVHTGSPMAEGEYGLSPEKFRIGRKKQSLPNLQVQNSSTPSLNLRSRSHLKTSEPGNRDIKSIISPFNSKRTPKNDSQTKVVRPWGSNKLQPHGNHNLEYAHEQTLTRQNKSLQKQLSLVKRKLAELGQDESVDQSHGLPSTSALQNSLGNVQISKSQISLPPMEKPKSTKVAIKKKRNIAAALVITNGTVQENVSARTITSDEMGAGLLEGRYRQQNSSKLIKKDRSVSGGDGKSKAKTQAALAQLDQQLKIQAKSQIIKQRELQGLIKLRDKLTQHRTGADLESQIYSDIFDLDDRIKEKEKDIEVLERALKTQDATLKKHFKMSSDGREATEIEKQIRQNDSLHRQIRTTQVLIKDADGEGDKLTQRRINLQELVENRTEVFKSLVRELKEHDYRLEQAEPLHGLDFESKTIAQECTVIHNRIEQIENEKLAAQERYKAQGLELDKKIGIMRIKVTIARKKLAGRGRGTGAQSQLKSSALSNTFKFSEKQSSDGKQGRSSYDPAANKIFKLPRVVKLQRAQSNYQSSSTDQPSKFGHRLGKETLQAHVAAILPPKSKKQDYSTQESGHLVRGSQTRFAAKSVAKLTGLKQQSRLFKETSSMTPSNQHEMLVVKMKGSTHGKVKEKTQQVQKESDLCKLESFDQVVSETKGLPQNQKSLASLSLQTPTSINEQTVTKKRILLQRSPELSKIDKFSPREQDIIGVDVRLRIKSTGRGGENGNATDQDQENTTNEQILTILTESAAQVANNQKGSPQVAQVQQEAATETDRSEEVYHDTTWSEQPTLI